MKTNSQIFFMALLCAAGFSACSVHAEGGSDATPIVTKPDAGLEGTWATGCTYENGVYQTETVTFHGNTFEDNVAQYSTTTCTGSPMVTAKVPGTFSTVGYSWYEQNGYDVDVVMTNPSGAAETHYFTTVIDGGRLYLPDPASDTLHVRPTHVDRSRPYTKVGG